MSDEYKINWHNIEKKHSGCNISVSKSGRFAVVHEMWCDGGTYLYIDSLEYSASIDSAYFELVRQQRLIDKYEEVLSKIANELLLEEPSQSVIELIIEEAFDHG